MKTSSYKNALIFGCGGIIIGLILFLLFKAIIQAETTYLQIAEHWHYLPLLLTPLGFVVISWLIRNYFSGAEGSGIPQVLTALKITTPAEQSKYLSLRIMLGKCLMVPAYLCGASLGYEGPAVQIGASLMMSLSSRLRLHHEQLRRGLIIAGGAAGLAAAFSAPLTGIVFSIEELSKNYHGKISSYILIAVILSGLISEAGLGHYIYLGHAVGSDYSFLLPDTNYWIIPICGIIGGTLGGVFSLSIVKSCKLLSRLKLNPILIALCAGLIVAIINLISHQQTAGCGASAIKAILIGQPLNIGFAPLKMLATLFTYLAGIPTGLFAPALAIGAGLSKLVIFGLPSSVNPQAVVLLMMVAFLCGVIQAPLTSFTVVMEISGQDAILLPLIATSYIAKLFAQSLLKIPLYQSLMPATENIKTKEIPVM